MRTKKRYELSFKERVVKLSYERSSITELAKKLVRLRTIIFINSQSKEFVGKGVDRIKSLIGLISKPKQP